MPDIMQTARDIAKKHCPALTPGTMDAIVEALNAPRQPMTEDEMLQRARRAAGEQNGAVVRTVLAALRDLDKPLVDPVVLACREIVAAAHPSEAWHGYRKRVLSGELDDKTDMLIALVAYKAARA